jgi:hypothetical protein
MCNTKSVYSAQLLTRAWIKVQDVISNAMHSDEDHVSNSTSSRRYPTDSTSCTCLRVEPHDPRNPRRTPALVRIQSYSSCAHVERPFPLGFAHGYPFKNWLKLFSWSSYPFQNKNHLSRFNRKRNTLVSAESFVRSFNIAFDKTLPLQTIDIKVLEHTWSHYIEVFQPAPWAIELGLKCLPNSCHMSIISETDEHKQSRMVPSFAKFTLSSGWWSKKKRLNPERLFWTRYL